MPRKGKKSQALKEHWRKLKLDLSDCGTSAEQEHPTSEVPELSKQHIPDVPKLSKQKRIKFKRRALALEKTAKDHYERREEVIQGTEVQKMKKRIQRTEVQKMKKRMEVQKMKYANDAAYREKQKSRVTRRYREDADYREQQKSRMTRRYSEDADYREQQKSRVARRYREDADYREQQKSRMTRRYREDADYREQQKSYAAARYANKKRSFTVKLTEKALVSKRRSTSISADHVPNPSLEPPSKKARARRPRTGKTRNPLIDLVENFDEASKGEASY